MTCYKMAMYLNKIYGNINDINFCCQNLSNNRLYYQVKEGVSYFVSSVYPSSFLLYKTLKGFIITRLVLHLLTLVRSVNTAQSCVSLNCPLHCTAIHWSPDIPWQVSECRLEPWHDRRTNPRCVFERVNLVEAQTNSPVASHWLILPSVKVCLEN